MLFVVCFCEAGRLGHAVWTPAVWALAVWQPETLAVINPASILSKHYFNQSNYYLRSHHFHQWNTYQARIHSLHESNFNFSQ